jgi:hypothetical protein
MHPEIAFMDDSRRDFLKRAGRGAAVPIMRPTLSRSALACKINSDPAQIAFSE